MCLLDYFINIDVILSYCPWKFFESGFWVSVGSPCIPELSPKLAPGGDTTDFTE